MQCIIRQGKSDKSHQFRIGCCTPTTDTILTGGSSLVRTGNTSYDHLFHQSTFPHKTHCGGDSDVVSWQNEKNMILAINAILFIYSSFFPSLLLLWQVKYMTELTILSFAWVTNLVFSCHAASGYNVTEKTYCNPAPHVVWQVDQACQLPHAQLLGQQAEHVFVCTIFLAEGHDVPRHLAWIFTER